MKKDKLILKIVLFLIKRIKNPYIRHRLINEYVMMNSFIRHYGDRRLYEGIKAFEDWESRHVKLDMGEE